MELIALLLIAIVFPSYIHFRVWRGAGVSQSDKDQIRLHEGIQLVERRLYTEAFAYFDAVIQKESRCALAFAYRGRCHLMQENWFHTIADCNRAASLDHRLDTIYLDKGIALFRLGHIRDAFVQFDKAIWFFNVNARPNADTFRWRGITHLKLGQYVKAEKDFKKAVELGDEHAIYFLSMRGDSLDAVEVED